MTDRIEKSEDNLRSIPQKKFQKTDLKTREHFAWWAQILANLATAVAVIFAAIEITNTRNERNLNAQLRAIELVTPRVTIQWQENGSDKIQYLHEASYSFETTVHNQTPVQSQFILDFQICENSDWKNETPPQMLIIQEYNGVINEQELNFSVEDGKAWLEAILTLQPGTSEISIGALNPPRDPRPFYNIPVALNGNLKSIKTDGGLSTLVGEVLKNTGMNEATWLLSLDKIVGQRVFNNLDNEQKLRCRSPLR